MEVERRIRTERGDHRVAGRDENAYSEVEQSVDAFTDDDVLKANAKVLR
jgi:hypothetical protein